MQKLLFIAFFLNSFTAVSQEWNCFSYEKALRAGSSTNENVTRHTEYVSNEGLNKRLDSLFHEDQRQRRDREFTLYKDIERSEAAFEEYEQGRLNHYCDFYQATMIFMHHPDGKYLKLANELAERALKLAGDIQPLRWLKCAAEDRLLHHSGKPQIWGTQQRFAQGEFTREPFDKSAVSAEARKRCFEGL